MTRRDYILIMQVLRVMLKSAENILATKRRDTPDYHTAAGAREGILAVIDQFADSLERDNKHFNREHFLAVIRREKELLSPFVRS